MKVLLGLVSSMKFTLSICLGLVPLLAWAGQPFVIKVVDEATGRGVPLVELTTVNGVTYVTDNAGVIAFEEPGLMNAPVFFKVSSHGYECPKDGFGFRGKRLMTMPGKTAEIRTAAYLMEGSLRQVAETVAQAEGIPLYDPDCWTK